MSQILPYRVLLETDTLLAFYHPRPAFQLHILLVPKKPIAGLMDLNSTDNEFVLELIESVQILVKRFNLDSTGYRLVMNGGEFQDFGYLHFHLYTTKIPS